MTDTISPYEKFVGREGIYFERGFVVHCRVSSAFLENQTGNMLYGFVLEIQSCLQLRQASASSGLLPAEFDVGPTFSVSSISVREEEEVITASGYVFWTLILNPGKIDEIMKAIGKADELPAKGDWITEPYGICRAVTDKHFRKRVHSVSLNPRHDS